MSDIKIYLGDIGTKLVVDTVWSLTGATSYHLELKPPSGEPILFPATGNCTLDDDTHLSYTFEEDDLDLVGVWKVQPVVDLGNWSGRGVTASFEVLALFT